MKRIMHKLLVSLCVALWASALSAQTHFTCDPHQFQYDMTIYFKLVSPSGSTISQTDNYEMAAFVGDECRGVGEFLTAKGTNGQTIKYGYMRVRSNVMNGETVTFKYYDKKEEEEKIVEEISIDFEANSMVGLPSSPMDIAVEGAPVLIGDVNGDEEIDLTDVVLIFDFFMGEELVGFIEAAADFNGDEEVDLTDVVLVFEYYMDQ